MSRPVPRGTYHRSCKKCGWTGTYTTAGQADYRKRRHPCAKRIDQAQRAAARQARLDAIDRTPKPCLHKVADHQHGTYAAYTLDGCRCTPCTNAASDYNQSLTRRNAYGRSNLVDATPARDHIQSLMARGMGIKTIIARSDVPSGTLWKLLYGRERPNGERTPTQRVTKDVAARVLAVEFHIADGVLVDGTETTRRLQALIASGWSGARLAEHLGYHRSNFTPLMHGRVNVTAGMARRVHGLYADLINVTPPTTTKWDRGAVTAAKNLAARNGWAPPLRIGGRAWVGAEPELVPLHTGQAPTVDDFADTTTDELDDAAIERRMAGDKTVRLSKAEKAELVTRWLTTGRPGNECERVTGVPVHRFRPRSNPAA